MEKYSYEFKKRVVESYLRGDGGYKSLAKEYGIENFETIRRWIRAYDILGDEGIKRSRRNKNYSFEFKHSIVKLYLNKEISYQDLALTNGMNNPSLICRWVHDYLSMGEEGLQSKRKGRPPKVPKHKEPKQAKGIKKSKYVEQLESENLKLRIENAYLKESRRLRLEEETLRKEKRELSPASEENSN